MPITLTEMQIDKLAEHLRGTCQTFSEGLDVLDLDTTLEETDFSEGTLKDLEDKVFRCSECNWWHEVSDMGLDMDDGETYCQDCRPEEDDDDNDYDDNDEDEV